MKPLPRLDKDPKAVRAIKKSQPVEVFFADSDGTWETLEGSVGYSAGDAILTGVVGERWPIELSTFRQTYEPVTPAGHGASGLYVKKPVIVWAKCLLSSFELEIKPGSFIRGEAGDWLIQYAPGRYGIVARGIFEQTYCLV